MQKYEHEKEQKQIKQEEEDVPEIENDPNQAGDLMF